MLLIYVSKLTNRIGYTLNLIFKSILHVPFEITMNKKYFCSYDGAKLCYSAEKIGDGLYINPVSLLFQTSIETQDIHAVEYEDMPVLFPTYGQDLTLPFDIFAASFYLVSRYEEYLPHHQDEHHRFKHTDSIAYQLGFLHSPIVNKWADLLAEKIKERYPQVEFPSRKFKFVATVDVDMAYSYKHKGILRNIGGVIKDIFCYDIKSLKARTLVLLNKRQDPYDTFDYILKVCEEQHCELLFFILFANYGNYDKNISYNNSSFQELIKHLGDYGKVGIHPSYASFGNERSINEEIRRLSDILHKPIYRSRFHFLHFTLPTGYQNLIDNNIRTDFSMGYSSEIGFRAGVCTPFNFYDLENDYETTLEIQPFAIMDTAMKTYLNLSPDEAFLKIRTMIDEIKHVEGTFYGIWHNSNLCNDFGWEDWHLVFEQTLEYANMITNKIR